MNTENKEKNIQPISDEELEHASGGCAVSFYCPNCGWQSYNDPADDICPRCGGDTTILNGVKDMEF